MKHGEAKEGSWRRERIMATDNIVTATGEVYEIRYASKEETGNDRWCEVCGEWRPSMGVIGGILCKHCTTAWNATDEEIKVAIREKTERLLTDVAYN